MNTVFFGTIVNSVFFKSRRVVAILVVICGFGTIKVQASIELAGWDMNGLTAFGSSPLAPSDTTANLTVGGLTRGSGFTTSGSAAMNGWGGNGLDSSSEANAITAGDFATFILAAQSGNTVSFTTISAYNVRRSSTGPTMGIWQYQVGGSAFADIGSAITWGSNTTTAGNSQSAIDLSGISNLQNIAAGTTVTFRLVDWGASSASTGNWYINEFQTGDDLQIQGAVNAVPEPAGWGLISTIGLLGLCGVSTWRKQRAVKRMTEN